MTWVLILAGLLVGVAPLPRAPTAFAQSALSTAPAQPAPLGALGSGLPDAFAGPWYSGECAAPGAVLFVTARAAVRVPARLEGEPARLFRFTALAERDGWTLGTAPGPELPRLLLRRAGDGLETIEPDAKVRDGAPLDDLDRTGWRRCVTPAVASIHAEGFALLAALEHVEAGCAGGADACLRALIAAGDVSGDGALSTAEIARLTRAGAWLLAVADGSEGERLASAVGIGTIAGLLARAVVDSFDYDADGKLSAAELGHDMLGFGRARGTASGTPWEPPAQSPMGAAMDALRGLIGGFGGLP